jgi:hypothetical protein
MRSTTNARRTSRAPKTRAARVKRARRGTSTSTVNHETSRDPRQDFNDDEWHDMVAAAADYRAQARGFEGGGSEDDWCETEAELREQLARAEDEADEKSESASDLADHDTGRDRDTV